jgi:hypothetical protein
LTLLNNLTGSRKKENPRPIKVNMRKITNDKKKADIFNKHFANVNRSTTRKQLDKALWKILKGKKKSPSANICPFEQEFSMLEMETAIKKLKCKKAPGPDKIKNEFICHLGKGAKEMLLSFINRTWREGKIPAAWRTADIIPILKKGKEPDAPQSYSP